MPIYIYIDIDICILLYELYYTIYNYILYELYSNYMNKP